MAIKEMKPFVLRPEQLVRYVEYAYVQEQRCVVGLHISQLARYVGVTPIVNGKMAEEDLPFSFIHPRQIDNIHEILSSAKESYPKSLSWWK